MGQPAHARLIITLLCGLVAACTTLPPETEYRLGVRKYTECHAIDVHPAGDHFAAFCDVFAEQRISGSTLNRTIEIVNIKDGKLAAKHVFGQTDWLGPSRNRLVADLAYSSDGKLLGLADGTGGPLLIDAGTFSLLELPLSDAEFPTTAATFSPDGSAVAFASGGLQHDGTAIVTVYGLAGRAVVSRTVLDSIKPVSSLSFSPDSRRLAVSHFSDGVGRISILDVSTGQVEAMLQQDKLIAAVAFTRDGTRLVTLADDLKIYDATAPPVPQLLRSALVTPGLWGQGLPESGYFESETRPRPAMALSPDGLYIAVSDIQNLVNIIDLETLEIQCRAVAGEQDLQPRVYYSGMQHLYPFPDDIAWVPSSDSIVVASHGLHVLRAARVYSTAHVVAAEHAVEISPELAAEVDHEMRRALLGTSRFDEGDELTVRYRILEIDEGSSFARFMIGSGNATIKLAVDFLDRNGTLLSGMTADGKTNIWVWNDKDTVSENMSVSAHLAWRRAAEQVADEAGRRFSCGRQETE